MSDTPTFSFSAAIREEFHISISSVSGSVDLNFNAIIEELKTHSAQIREAHKAVENSHSVLEKQVIDMRNVVKQKEQELKLLNSWPLQIADDALKWMDVWESKFGKRVINSQTNQLAENLTVVNMTAQTVNYCRRFIYAKRSSHEEWRASSQQMRIFYESEIKRVQKEIVQLRSEVSKWELCSTKNELYLVELTARLKQLQSKLFKKRSLLENLGVEPIEDDFD